MAPNRDRRPGFSRRAQYSVFVSYVIGLAGALVAALLLAIAIFSPPTFAALRLAAAEITTPVSSALAAVTRGVASIPTGIGDYFFVRGRNAALRKQIDDDRALLMRARGLVHENQRLKALLAVRDRIAMPVVVARLVSSTLSSTRRFAVLNAGFLQGVREGQPVRAPDGLVGRILEAGPNSARVLLLGDAESIVPVRRSRDGLPAIAAGRGDGLIEIRSVNVSNVIFEPGDVLMTSGTGGIYPPNIPVARVVRRSRDTALAHPLAQPDIFDFALVEQAFMVMPQERNRPR